MGLQVDTVFVWVTDLDASVGWYALLGIESGPRHGAWQTMVVDGEARFALHEGTRTEGPSTAVVSFLVDDLQAEIDRLDALDIVPIDDITDTGVARFVTFRDPDDNEIQLLER